ncbi:MAG TPA: hypothetical protein VGK16_09480 [Candidatus Limnocylindrales bacterium]|jgi:hypothetical protein
MPERDPMTFETRLADAFGRYVVAAPVDVDARTLAAVAAADAPRRYRGKWGFAPRWAIALGLLAALALGGALVAGALLRAQPGPLGGGGRLMVFTRGTAIVLGADGSMQGSRSVETRGGSCPRLVAGGAGLAASTFGGIRVGGIDAPGKATMLGTNYSGGERWSRDGRVLARVRFTEGITFTTFPDGPTGDPVNVDVAPGAIGSGIGVIEANLSPDGSTLAVLAATTPEQVTADPRGAVDVLLVDSASGSVRTVGRHERGSPWLPTWSPGGRWAGLVTAAPDGSATGWIVDAFDGSERSVPLGTSDPELQLLAISADGARVLVLGGAILRLLDAVDGRAIASVAATDVSDAAWGPDGRSFAWVGREVDPSSGVAGSATPGSVLHVHAADGALLRDIPVADFRFAWSPDGSAIAVIGQDQRVLVHFPWTGSPPLAVATLDLGGVDDSTCIAWTGDVP